MQKKPVSKLPQTGKKAPAKGAAKPAAKEPRKASPKPPPKLDSPGAMTRDWVELQKDVLICPGSYCQGHKRFKGHNQQSSAVCIVACAYAGLRKMNTWTKGVVDEILDIGTALYLKSRQISDNRCLTYVEPPEVYKYFFIDNVKVSMRIGVDLVTARVPRDSTMLNQMENLLSKFFANNTSGIFACQQTYLAIWKFDKYYFIFDPTEHNLQGGKWDGVLGMGFCYSMRFRSIKHLADIILKNCPLKPINKFTIYPCRVEKHVVVNTTPPETIESQTPLPPEAPKPLKKSRLTRSPPPTIKSKVSKTEQKKEAAAQGDQGPQGTMQPKKSVSKSMIPPERPRLKSVTNFVELLMNRVGILRASTHNKDPKFTRYLGAQSLGDAVAALTMLRQHKSKHWIRTILDEVLKLGEVIHHDSKDLSAGQVPTKITLNEKNYSPKIEKISAMGRLESSDDKILNLEQALRDVLIDSDCCILMGPSIIAIWKEDNRYYMFDPEERDTTGRTSLPEQPGVACVTWFSQLNDLVTLYMHNTPKAYHKDRFIVRKVVIKDYIQMAEDWYNFRALTFNKWILRGNFSQQDRRFSPESRNAQCTANATMALTYKELKQEQDWDNSTVDDVLISGDEFYRGCVQTLQECGKFKHKYLMVDELNRNFDVLNKRVNLEIDDCLVNGVINAKSDTGIPNLKRGFEEFFLESEAGIVTANLQSMAVWRRDETYYYYDSHSRNEKGVVCGFGTACILRLVNIDDLANAMMTNLGPDRQNFYNISRVVVRLIDLTDEGVVKPPLHFYEALNDLVAILRSNTNEKDKKFNINSGKQTVPMCLAALAFNSLSPSFDWSKDDLDEILTIGDKLYVESMEANYNEELSEEMNVDDISTVNVKKDLKIGSNKFELEIEEVSSGNLEENLKEGIEGLNERVASEGNEVFQSIIESQYMTVSMWRDDNLFYLFDPRPRDERGQVYGKDDWSAKMVFDEEGYEEEGEAADNEADEAKEDEDKWQDDDDDRDEMAGGDNLGEYQSEQVMETNYETKGDDDADGNKSDDEDDNFDDDEQEGEEEAPPSPLEKKGSTFWRLKEEEGKACVMRFSQVDDLIKHLLENSPPNRRQEIDYSLKMVKVANTPVLHEIFDPEVEDPRDEFAGDWNEFKEVDYGKWILRSVRNLNDELFPEVNRGKQEIPMCMVALAFASLYALSKFTQPVVDSILAYGDRLYTLACKMRAKELKENKDLGLSDEEIEAILKSVEFRIMDYPKNICMGEKLVKWEAKMEVILGDTTSKEPEAIPNIPSGLTTFFEEHKFGILVCREYPVAVWKLEDIFYMFDPHPTGPSGIKSPVGVACISRFKEVEDLVTIYQGNLPKYGNNFFEIHSFSFTKEPCVRERHPEEKEEKAPKLGGFSPVTAGKNILRGEVKLDCTKYDRGVHIHSAAIAFVALALSLNKEPDTWTKIIINEILTVGEELYNDTIDKLGTKFNPWADKLDICRVNTDFMIGRLKVNTAIRFTEQRGIVDVKNSKTPNLRQGLERFFEENSHGILLVDKLILPIWEQMKDKEVNIYIFDPNSRGATGLPSQGGMACAMKFCNAKVAADHIMSCLMDVDKTKTEFAIIPVEIVVGTTRTKRKVCKLLTTKPVVVMEPPKPTPTLKRTLPCPCKPAAVPRTSKLETKTKFKGSTMTRPAPSPMVTPRGASKGTTTLATTSKGATSTLRTTKAPSTLNRSTLKTPTPAKSTVVKTTTTTMTTTLKKPLAMSTKPVTCPDKAMILEEKRTLRKIAEEERAREEAKRCALLGRNAIYEINNNEAIVRGLRAIVKDRELPVNVVAFVFMKVATDLAKWTYKQIELVLETGYQLYVDSFNAYKPPTTKLTLQHLLRRVLLKGSEVKVEIKKPIPAGLFKKESIFTTLTNFFTITNFCMLSYCDCLVSIYFKSGYYYLFDPYSRDLNGNKADKGAAMLMRFGDLQVLADKLVANLQNPEDPPMHYALLVVAIQSVEPIAQ